MPDTQKPISEQQFAANRANAAKSTGPKTPEGKARSSQNAVKHGFTGSAFAVVRLEDLQEVANLKADIVDVYQPVNSQELVALERMALAQQSMFRAGRLEAGLFTTCMNDTLNSENHAFAPMSQEIAGNGDIQIARSQNRNYCLADGFQHQIRKSNVWSLFLRYQAQAERQYRRALEEFLRLKALRNELLNEPILVQPEETTELYTVPDIHQPFIGPLDKETSEQDDAARVAAERLASRRNPHAKSGRTRRCTSRRVRAGRRRPHSARARPASRRNPHA